MDWSMNPFPKFKAITGSLISLQHNGDYYPFIGIHYRAGMAERVLISYDGL